MNENEIVRQAIAGLLRILETHSNIIILNVELYVDEASSCLKYLKKNLNHEMIWDITEDEKIVKIGLIT